MSGQGGAAGVDCGHRYGPLLYWVPARRPVKARLMAILVLGACLALFVVAARLQPSARGLGTHQQLGLAPCSLVVMTGFPCPTCGMTTSFAYAVRGRFIAAFRTQPAGMLAAIGTLIIALAATGSIAAGKVWVVNWLRVSPGWLIAALVGVFLGGWLFKVATGLIGGTLPIR